MIRLSIIAAAVMVVVVAGCYVVVSANANGKTYDKATDIPCGGVGLLLGTSPITPQGEHNYYFDNRIKATAELYHSGRISRVIASGGDYSDREDGCDELSAMRDSLIAYGVPDSVITLDYQGRRTVNSIVKAKNCYGLDSLTIISQRYHNERAIWLAEHYGLHPVAYNAPTPDITNKRIKNISREFLARVKMFFDLATGKRPEFELEDKHVVHGTKIELTDYTERLPYDVYTECCNHKKPQPNISLSNIIGKWENRGRYISYILTLGQNGVYCMALDVDTVWNPYKINYTKHGNYSYDSITNRITLRNYHATHELDSMDYIKYGNPRNKEFIIVNLSDETMSLFECGAYRAYVNQYRKMHTFL